MPNLICSLFSYFVASDPPVLKCPSDISAETDPKSSTTKVTWPSPDVIDNAGVVSLMSDHQAGSEFSIGRSEVTYTARDPSGNIATCTFTVNVIGMFMKEKMPI